MRMRRADLLDELAARICAINLAHPTRVAIDGVDAAGKTTLADELVKPIESRGRVVIRASIDGFHRPRAERYRRGADSPQGYYYDSFDYAALRTVLLEPLGQNGNREYRRRVFDFRIDAPITERPHIAPANSVLLFDGVFLFRPELNGCWDCRVFVQVNFETAVERAATRDQVLFGDENAVCARYAKRYVPGQHIYLQAVRPQDIADVIVDNNDPANPELLVRNAKRGVW